MIESLVQRSTISPIRFHVFLPLKYLMANSTISVELRRPYNLLIDIACVKMEKHEKKVSAVYSQI